MEKRVFSNELIPLVKELLEDGQDVMLTVSGNSMRPFYHHHRTVVKLRYPKENLQKYDVILYQVHNQYKLHRIYEVHEDVYIVYGDALTDREIISKVQVFGVVISHTEKKKTIEKDNKSYLFKVRMWALLKPFRRLLLRLFGG